MNSYLSNCNNGFDLPQKICNTTIGDLISQPNVEIHKTEYTFTVRSNTSEGIATFKYKHYQNGGSSAEMTNFPNTNMKKDKLEIAKQREREGRLRKDIAYELGMSPSYLTQLLNKDTR